MKRKIKCRKIGKLFPLVSVAAVCGILLTNECAAMTRHQWLNFFFDGVPPETSATNNQFTQGATNKNQPTAAPEFVPPITQTNILHPPFADGKCSECHGGQTAMSPVPRLPTKQLCFTCHKDFLAGEKVKHQPVENGECLDCHDPHQSPNKNLLVKKGNALCLTCHDDPLSEGKFKHQAVELAECVDCHSPHASNFKGMLKESVKATCYECHEDVVGKKKDVHQPVENGDCTACHAPHAGADKNLLIKTGAALCWQCHDNFLEKAKFTHDVADDCTACHNAHASDASELLSTNLPALCFECHDPKDIAAVKGHANIGAKSCLDCHDPHMGDNVNLLKSAAQNPGATKGTAP